MIFRSRKGATRWWARLSAGSLIFFVLLSSLGFDPSIALAANTKIRQEVNITDTYLTAASGSYATSSEIILLDTSKYSGATYYFEVVASTTSATNATISLVNATSGAPVKHITVNGTSYARYRSSAFTATSTQMEFAVRLGNEAVRKGIVAARLVIIQDTASIDSTETQIEIGSNETYTSAATSTFTNPKYWTYDSAKWDGSPTFYAEVTYARTVDASFASSTTYSTAGTFTVNIPANTTSSIIELYGGGGGGGAASTNTNGSGSGGAGGQYAKKTIANLGGLSKTLVVGNFGAGGASTAAGSAGGDSTWDTNVVVAKGGAGGAANSGTAGAGSATGGVGDTVNAGGSGRAGVSGGNSGGGGGGAGSTGAGGAAGTAPAAGTGTAIGGGNGGTGQSTNGTPAQASQAGGGGAGGRSTGSPNVDGGDGGLGKAVITNTINATASTTIALQEDNGSFGSWTDKVYIVTADSFAASTSTRVRSNSFVPTTGRHYRLAFREGYTGATHAIYNAKIVIDQTSPTLLEPQYLMANTKLATGTGLQNYLVSWDSSEWSGVSNTYIHQVDAAASSASAVGIYTTANALVVGSTVTSPNNVGVSSAMTMPANGNLDVKATTNNNDIYANRILVDVAVRPQDVSSATVTAGDTLNTLSWANPSGSLSKIMVVASTSAITFTPTDGATYSTSTLSGASRVACYGLQTSCIDSSLSNGTAYYYKIFVLATNGSWSTPGVAPTGSPATPVTQTYTEQAYKFFNATSISGAIWTGQTAAQANSWRSVTYGNGLFVAVAADGTNRVMTSPDGSTWTAQSAAEANTWNSVTYGNGLFVAVSSDGTHRVMTSPDGVTWTAQTAAEANGWISVTYGNGLFVAVAGNGTNRVMTSSDGVTWTPQAAAEANNWKSVTYGNGKFVAVASTGTNRVMTSTNGSTWTPQAATAALPWNSVAYGNGTFVAVAATVTNQLMTSPDGVTWTAQTGAATTNWFSVIYGNGTFVALAADNAVDQVMTSPDGVTWTARTAVEPNGWWSITYGNGLFVAVALDGTHQVMTSGTFGPHPGAELAATSTAATLTSSGQAFRLRLLNRVDTANLAANSGKSFKLQYATKSGTCDTSFSGETYADITSSTPIAWYDNPDFTNGTTTVATTTDPIDPSRTVRYEDYMEDNNWTNPVAIAAGETGLWDFSLYDNGASASTSYCIRAVKSTDAQTWTAQSAAGNDDDWNSVTYGNGLFVAVGQGGSGDHVMTSPDGITWTAQSAAGNDDFWNGVTYGGGTFVAVGDGTSGNAVMTSTNGTSWSTQSAVGNNDFWASVTYGNGLFVAVSNSGDRVMTSPDGVTWTAQSAAGNDDNWQSVTYGNSFFVAVGTGPDHVMTSPDGVTWTARSAAGDDDFWNSVTYGNGLFVAVGQGGSGDHVMTSPDGITWTAQSAAGNDDGWQSVAYGNGLFVAVGWSGNRIMTSPDAVSWTVQTASANDTWYSVVYSNGLFVAVSEDPGNPVMTSPISATTLDTYTVVPEVTTAAAGAASLTQLHYRWRNDDAGEVGATFAAAEDTALTSDVFVGDRRRLRFVISDTSGSASSYTYQLQQASSSCTAWINVPDTESNGTHWVADLSQYYLSGGATTNSSGLTDPNGKSFVAGYQMSGAAITPAHSLTSSQFTEHEFSIRSTGNVSFGTTYCFRLTNAGSATGFTYTVTPQIVVTQNSLRKAGGGTSTEGSGTSATITGGSSSGGGGAGGECQSTSSSCLGGFSPPIPGGNSGGGGGGDTGFIFLNKFFALLYGLGYRIPEGQTMIFTFRHLPVN